jgi:hypothetical protein
VPPASDEQPATAAGERLTATDILRWSAGISGPLTLAMLSWIFLTLMTLKESNAVIISKQAELSSDHQETKVKVERLSDKLYSLDASVKAIRMIVKLDR